MRFVLITALIVIITALLVFMYCALVVASREDDLEELREYENKREDR